VHTPTIQATVFLNVGGGRADLLAELPEEMAADVEAEAGNESQAAAG